MSRPFVLVTNDDGYQAPGLRPLWQALESEYETFVVAPARPRSWIGKALSNPGELTVAREAMDGKTICVVNDGTPADCVNLGLYHLCPRPPALVVAGINIGANFTSSLILASGTVGAALEAAVNGVPALAVSLDLDEATEHAVHNGAPDAFTALFQPAAALTRTFLRQWFETPHPPNARLVNLILPQAPREPPQFVECAPLPYAYGSVFVQRGGAYYNRRRGFVESAAPPDDGSDVWAVRHGFAAYTCYTGALERTHAHTGSV